MLGQEAAGKVIMGVCLLGSLVDAGSQETIDAVTQKTDFVESKQLQPLPVRLFWSRSFVEDSLLLDYRCCVGCTHDAVTLVVVLSLVVVPVVAVLDVEHRSGVVRRDAVHRVRVILQQGPALCVRSLHCSELHPEHTTSSVKRADKRLQRVFCMLLA